MYDVLVDWAAFRSRWEAMFPAKAPAGPDASLAFRQATEELGLTVRERTRPVPGGTAAALRRKLRGSGDDPAKQPRELHATGLIEGTPVEGFYEVGSAFIAIRAGRPSDARFEGIRAGDPDFDSRVRLLGARAPALAIADAATRGRCLDLWLPSIGEGAERSGNRREGSASGDRAIELSPDGVTIALPCDPTYRQRIGDTFRRAAGIVAGLDGSSTPERLRASASHDPVPGVRRRCLETLLDEFPDHPAALATRRDAARWPEADLRLVARLADPSPGQAIDVPLLVTPELDPALRERGMTRLMAGMTRDHRNLVYDGLLRGEGTSLAALAAARRFGDRFPAATIASLIRSHGSLEVAHAAVDALGHSDDPGAGAALVPLLADRRIVSRVLHALAAVGDRDCVEPLRALRSDPEIAPFVVQALASIRSRLVGAEAGQLAFADPAGGALSPAESSGALSIAKRT